MKTKVLLIDDDVIIQAVMTDLFKDLNCEVDVFNNGEAAFKNFKNAHHYYQLILTDVELGKGMRGNELGDLIRDFEAKYYPDERIPIIGMTSNLSPTKEINYLEKGFDMVLTKPISKNQLEEVLKIFTEK